MRSSRRTTRHQSRRRTSPSAIARMTSVAACEPELPPLLMMSGTNSARTTARAISFSKNPIAVAVSISPTNSTASQPAALADHVGEADLEVRRVEGLAAADLLDVLGGLLLHHVHDVVGRDDALHPALGVDDGDGQQAFLGEAGARPPPGRSRP